jgi:Bacterial Ig-like domain
MAGPNVTSASPANNAQGVVLGQSVTVVFDSLIDHSTLTPATVSVTFPSGAEVLTPDAYIALTPKTLTGTAYVDGTLSITDADTATTLTFTPSLPLRPNTLYTVFLLGGDAQFSPAAIKDTDGNPLAASYQWTFTTGSLNLPAPPVSSPLPPIRGAVLVPLDPGSVRIDPRVRNTDNDLTDQVSPSGQEQKKSRARARRLAFREVVTESPWVVLIDQNGPAGRRARGWIRRKYG